MTKKPVNINSILIMVFTGLVGFLGKESYKETRATHDAVIVTRVEVGELKEELRKMVPRAEFDMEMSQLKARLSSIEIDIEKLKRAPTK